MSDDVRDLDDQQAVVDLAGRLAESLPPFTWTVGPDTDGVTSLLVAPADEAEARAFFAERPLAVDGDRVLEVSTRPAAG
ncbi:hypothetical protein [Nocardioides marmoraquaticus]